MGKFVLVVLLFAAVVYGLMWTLERRRPTGTRPTSRPRSTAPDDDEEFLRRLNRQRREDSSD